ncbi:Phage protein [Acinetobacter baumannii]
MRTSSQLFPENKIVTVDDLVTARSEAKNDMGDINALLSAIELSLVEKLKDHNLSKFAFDKTFRLIDIAKTQADLSQDYHNGELAQLTGGQYQLDELKNNITHLEVVPEKQEINTNHLAPANAAISKTLTEGFKNDGRR